MKKVKYFVLLCVFAILSTGCVKFNATMSIKNDKSMDFSIIYAFDKSLTGGMTSVKEEDFADLKKEGYSVEEYKEGNYEGFKITRKISNIDDVSTDKDVEFDLSGMMQNTENNKHMFKVVKNGEKSTYYAKFKFDSSSSSNSSSLIDDEDEEDLDDEESILPDKDEDLVTTTSEDDLITTTGEDDEDSDDISSGMDLSALTDSMDLSFKVILPNSAISSNATTKANNDKELTWKLNYSGNQTIEFAFELDPNASDSNNLLLYIGIGVGVVLILLVILLLTRKGGKKEVVANDTHIEIKNDTNENVVSGPALNEKVNVTENSDQKDNA